MRISIIVAASCLVIACAPGGAVRLDAASEWRTFTSPEGDFTAAFPKNWNILPPLRSALDIVSFPLSKRERGSIIPQGGARVVLLERPIAVPDMETWVRLSGVANDEVSRSSVVLRNGTSTHELRATEILSEWADGDIRYQNVDCYFEVSGRLFSARLTDSKAAEYRRVLHGVVESVGVAQGR